MDAAPGALEQLPYGTEFQSADWQYPDSAYAPFVLQRLRRISSGLNMSYNTLANDLTSVNFSSIRAGLMDEREHWKALQSWWIARFERPIFLKWLEVQLLNQNLNLPFSKFAKFATADFRPRRWAWVDPMRDVQANLAAIAGGLKSRNEIITETSDRDFTETADELAKEKEYAAQVGIELPAVNAVGAGSVSGGLDTTEDSDNPDADQMAAGAETIQLSALNGAQVQALTQLIAAVSQGQIPAETAKATIAAAFPLMTEQQISAMMKPLAGFKPKSQPESSPKVDTAK
jgi:capsid protein